MTEGFVTNGSVNAAKPGLLPGLDDESDAGSRRARVRRLSEERRAALSRELLACIPDAGHEEAWMLELGCGHGHFLAGYAAKFADHRCFGVDYSRHRIARARRKAASGRLDMAHFLHGSAEDFLAVLPPGRVFDRVFVLFPDPWPKRRHRKYRLFRPEMLQALANVSRPGAELYFRTDFRDYFEETVRLIHRHPAWEAAPAEVWPFEQATVFQRKAECFYSLKAFRT